MKLHINIAPENSDLSIDFGVEVPDKYFNFAREGIRVIDAIREAITNIKWGQEESEPKGGD